MDIYVVTVNVLKLGKINKFLAQWGIWDENYRDVRKNLIKSI